LDSTKAKSDEDKTKFCDLVLKILELTPLKDCLVGSAEEGGLSFEQKKRLSIAVELAASPSILFLDEVSKLTSTCSTCHLLFPFSLSNLHVIMF
jgi:ABC-type multidrug transport system ATPase subunit